MHQWHSWGSFLTDHNSSHNEYQFDRFKDTSFKYYIYSAFLLPFSLCGFRSCAPDRLQYRNHHQGRREGHGVSRNQALHGYYCTSPLLLYHLVIDGDPIFVSRNSRKCLKRLLCLHECFLCSASSPRDLPVFCKWRHRLCFWSGLVVTGGDRLWGSSWMGESWADENAVPPFIHLHSLLRLRSRLHRGPMISTPVTQWSLWFSSSAPSVSSTAQPGPKTWFRSWGRWEKHHYLMLIHHWVSE